MKHTRTIQRPRRWAAVAVLAAVGLAGCGSSAKSASTTPSTQKVTDSIELGFVTTAVSNAASFGAAEDKSVNESTVIEALVKAFNDRGGIAGRRIVPVIAKTDTAGASWDADFAAACATFTQDHHVQAVLGYTFAFQDSLEQCLAEKGIPHLSSTFAVPDTAGLRELPTFLALSTPSIDHRSIAKIDAGLAAGALSTTSRLGVVLDSCPGTMRSWDDVVRPHLKEKGITVASTFELGCASGAADATTDIGRLPNLVLQFRSAKVDEILFATVSEGPTLFLLSSAAESQKYRPNYLVSSLAQTAVLAELVPRPQAEHVRGVGWSPVQDVKQPQWPSTPPATTRCLDLLAKEGVVPTKALDYSYALTGCEALFLYEQALKSTGGRSDGPAVVRAVESMGDRFASTINLDGKSRFGAGRHDGPAAGRWFAWDSGCACFAYDAQQAPLP